jgi:cell division protease FtsH
VKRKLTTFLVWAGIVTALVVFFVLQNDSKPASRVTFETFRRNAEGGFVEEVWIDGNEITVRAANGGGRYATLGVLDSKLEQTLSKYGAVVHRGKEEGAFSSLGWWALVLAVVAAALFFLRKMGVRSGNAGIFSMRKSRARLISNSPKVTFADVGGCQEAKELLGDVLDFLRNPQRWLQAGTRLPRGVLLEGPPGCGKTLLARAVAGETNARFYLVSACEFVEMFVGVGAARVRDMFETAAKSAPAVIFIDELDSLGRRRGSGIGSGHDEREQTLNQLLVCLDGFHANDRVVVLAATNRPDVLDSALLRPGRFDRRIRVPELGRQTRLEVLRIHTRNKKLAADVSLDELAGQTEGFNGAQLENLANEAALLAVRRHRSLDGQPVVIGRDDFRRALQPAAEQSQRFDKLDAVLIESAAQVAEPTGKAVVRLTLADGATVEGAVVWVDATFIKLRAGGGDVVVAKDRVSKLEALAGTEIARSQDILPDAWAHRPTETA